MNPLSLSIVGTMVVVAVALFPRLWVRLVGSVLIWIEVVFLSTLYPGIIARVVVRAQEGDLINSGSFQMGVQRLGEGLFPCQLAIIYLSLAIVLCFVIRRGSSRALQS
jgi:hypothetical protein